MPNETDNNDAVVNVGNYVLESEATAPPDLRTLEGALAFLDHHAPSAEQRAAHQIVNTNFQTILKNVWQNIPAGPGRTVFLRDLNRGANEC